jgi:hypothetical protein
MTRSRRIGAIGAFLGAVGLALTGAAPPALAQTDPQTRPGMNPGQAEGQAERGVSPAAPITVVGTIRAASKDAAGKPTALMISDPKLGTFTIASEGKGKELMSHVGESATLIGRFELAARGEKILKVERYTLAKG